MFEHAAEGALYIMSPLLSLFYFLNFLYSVSSTFVSFFSSFGKAVSDCFCIVITTVPSFAFLSPSLSDYDQWFQSLLCLFPDFLLLLILSSSLHFSFLLRVKFFCYGPPFVFILLVYSSLSR